MTGFRVETPKEIVERNRSMIDVAILNGVTWKALATRLGIGHEQLRKAIDPSYMTAKDKVLADKEKLLAMHASGMTWEAVAAATGHKVRTMVNNLDPSIKERKREYDKRRQRYTPMFQAAPKVEVRGELPPPDTRNLTQRICGDPLPGRSYLDRMRAQQENRV